MTRQEATLKCKEMFGETEELIQLNPNEKEAWKDVFPKACELIEKLDDTKLYVNVTDRQSGTFACGRYGTLQAWAYQVCEWAYLDDYEDDYTDLKDANDITTVYLCPLMDNFRESTLIDLINEIWDIGIEEMTETEKKAELVYYGVNLRRPLSQLWDRLATYEVKDKKKAFELYKTLQQENIGHTVFDAIELEEIYKLRNGDWEYKAIARSRKYLN